jgi:hypothetical protein
MKGFYGKTCEFATGDCEIFVEIMDGAGNFIRIHDGFIRAVSIK